MTTVTDETSPSAEQARKWLARWDRQQEYYIPDREERFEVIADVVTSAVRRTDPTIVDLGAGPGSLSVRLLDRIPSATVVAVDADPLLLGLARSAHRDRAGLRLVESDLRSAGWLAATGIAHADAVVSTTALHWLGGAELAEVYRTCAAVLRPGGVFVDGDHFDAGDDQPGLAALARSVADARARRADVVDNEQWQDWWDAVAAAPELRGLCGRRGARPIEHHVPDLPTLREHERLLRAAGFAEVGTVWQWGFDRVLVAVR